MAIPTVEMGDLFGVPWPEKRVERFRHRMQIPTGGAGHHQPMSACECHQFFVYNEVVGTTSPEQARIWAPAVDAVAFLYSLGLYSPQEILDARWVLVDLRTGWRLFWDDLVAAAALLRVAAGALVGLRLPEPAWHRIYGELANGDGYVYKGYPALSMS
jgi:hypothetical protein